MRRVIVESPYAADTPGELAENVAFAEMCLRDCLLRGEAPYASHLLYTRDNVLSDKDASEQARGIEAGLVWGQAADATVVYLDRGVSKGMKQGIERAHAEKRIVEERRLFDDPERLHAWRVWKNAGTMFELPSGIGDVVSYCVKSSDGSARAWPALVVGVPEGPWDLRDVVVFRHSSGIGQPVTELRVQPLGPAGASLPEGEGRWRPRCRHLRDLERPDLRRKIRAALELKEELEALRREGQDAERKALSAFDDAYADLRHDVLEEAAELCAALAKKNEAVNPEARIVFDIAALEIRDLKGKVGDEKT